MQVNTPEKVQCIVLAGHSDTGKTSLAASLLFTAGIGNRLGKVDEGTAPTDFDPEEQQRKISIGLAAAHLNWNGHRLYLLDTPGYGIFFTETLSGLRVADLALVCVNSVAGPEVNTEKVWEAANELGLPVVFYLSKLDRERADFHRSLAGLTRLFGRSVLPVQFPIGSESGFSGVVDLVTERAYQFPASQNGRAVSCEIPEAISAETEDLRRQLLEAVAESDEELLEAFFEQGTLTPEQLAKGLRRAIRERKIFPVTVGAPLYLVGNSTLLDFLVQYAPSAADRIFPAQHLDGRPETVRPNLEKPALAITFKTLNDTFTGRISLIRVLRGTITNDALLVNPRTMELEKLHGLSHIQGKQLSAIPQLIAGEIGAVPKLKLTLTGDSLAAREEPLRAGWIQVPEPAMAFALEPKAKGDEEKIGEALARLTEEDPSLRVGRDPQTHELLLSGTGQLHVEIALARMKRRSNVDVLLHPPKVPYRETISRPAEGHGRHKKQTGGRGQFADCKIKVEPLPRGADFEFVDEIFGGAIPQNFRPAVEKGIQEARAKGYLAGYPMVDFRVRLVDGQYHEVDSSELAFKIAGSLAYKDAMAKAQPLLLEPIMKVEIHTTDEFMGEIMSDLSHRRGRPQGLDARPGGQVVRALVPLAEMLNYASALRSMTQGRSSFQMEFSHYEEVPRPIQERIIAESRRHAAVETEE